ncbi:MAG: hypothetical protein M9950_10145 [Thermomicrobiales bacterium]|nr:hypothetical protein [Thermomicrobiales bacterium]
MPEELVAIAKQGEFDEFDLNAFFAATGEGGLGTFTHKTDVQKWLDILRGAYLPTQIDAMHIGSRPPLPYSDVHLLPYMQHAFGSCPMLPPATQWRICSERSQNVFTARVHRIGCGGERAGIGLEALPPVRAAVGNGIDTKTITLSCGKLTTGVTVKEWSSILMLRNLDSPETYFQAAFRVQSPWAIRNPNGDNPHEELVWKPVCCVFDFAPTRALRQLADYGVGLAPEQTNPEQAVAELVKFLPVLAYDGADMRQIDAGGVLDYAMSGTTASMLAKKWQSAILVNVDNETLRRIMNNPAAMSAVQNIEGFRQLGLGIIETVVNQSEAVAKTRKEKGDDLSPDERTLSKEEKEYKKTQGNPGQAHQVRDPDLRSCISPTIGKTRSWMSLPR